MARAEFSVLDTDVAAAAPPEPRSVGPAPAAPGAARGRIAAAPDCPAPWPGAVPGDDEVARLLGQALAGAGTPAPEAIARAGGALAELDRALGGGPPDGTEVVARATALRLRLALAVASAPPAGAPIDAGAVEALLVETDAVLPRLTALVSTAPEAARPAVDALHTALVREAIDLTEAAQRLQPRDAAPAAPAPSAQRSRRAPQARVLSNVAAGSRAVPRLVRRPALVALAVAALAAAAFHLHAALTRPPPPEPPSFAGAPRNTVAVRDRGVAFVVAEPGRTLDAKEVERFRAREEIEGNAVTEVAPGVYVSTPASAGAVTVP